MLDLRPVLYLNGLLLVVLGAAMSAPILIDLYYASPDWQVFLAAAMVTEFIGVALILTNRGSTEQLTLRQGFILTASLWVILPAFGALPIAFSELNASYTDAFFEAMSGLTTTGSTVLVGLDTAPPGILMWRAILHWLGGVGIIVMAMSVLPALQVAGYQLFRTEFSDKSEKIVPRVAQLVGIIAAVYGGLTLLCIASYLVVGMSPFEAVAHAFATVSTGGFATSDNSIGNFRSASVDMVVTLFMFLSAVPFILYYRAVRGDGYALWRDNQVQLMTALVLGFTLIVALWLWFMKDFSLANAIRYSAFNVVSVMTGTGFANADYQAWGSFAVALFFFIGFLGGCAGSSTGGIKMFRFWILFSMISAQLQRMLQPHGLFFPRYNDRRVSPDAVGSVMSFLFLFIVCFLALTVALMATGLDIITAVTGAATALANLGPGMGEIIGPAGNFQPLPDAAKWLLSLGMMLGRLELFTILVLLTPGFWRA